jgi:arabinose-5-phosphate isomerase
MTNDNVNSLETGRRAIETEMEGLKLLATSLDDNFEKAVNVIHTMKTESRARLIVAGIGKSGHVARKITATLASTGTPSHFVHANEASHGDLGMIMEGDVVMLLSNSGESTELSDLIHYTRRFGITLIAITAKADSSLATHADIVLLLPKAAEACPIGMAPTTSTTMQLALGDALAVALLEKMGLTKEDFKVFHPGGKLGQKLLSVADLMHKKTDLPMLPSNAKMDDVIVMLAEKNLGCVILNDEQGELAGIITDGDLKRHIKSPDFLSKDAASIMTREPKSIQAGALAVEALNIMTKTEGRYLTSLIVRTEEGRLAGLIRLQDCLQRGVA